ncbi:MAG: hypothetical protein IJU14_05090 [Clostridia bacterium]|nr:hypothetical protein [Clostridia bacterium]
MLTEETKKLLEDYFLACSNLYGIIPLRSVLKIYNSQNEPITAEDFYDFVENFNFDDKFYGIIGHDEIFEDEEETPITNKTLAADYLLEDFDDYLDMEDSQFRIPYYVPPKEKFLKYTDDFYFEKTLEYIELRAFLRDLPYLSKQRADAIAEDVVQSVAFGEDEIEFGISEAIRMGVDLEDDKVRKKFLELLKQLDKNVRKHAYCGHTKQELLDMRIY